MPTITCTRCHALVNFPSDRAGYSVQCPQCGTLMEAVSKTAGNAGTASPVWVTERDPAGTLSTPKKLGSLASEGRTSRILLLRVLTVTAIAFAGLSWFLLHRASSSPRQGAEGTFDRATRDAEESKVIAVALLEAWKTGDKAPSLWRGGKPLDVDLHTVCEYHFLKSMAGDDAWRAELRWWKNEAEGWVQGERRALRVAEEVDLDTDPASPPPLGKPEYSIASSVKGIREALRKEEERLADLEQAVQGDPTALAKFHELWGPIVYATHRFRIESTTEEGVPIEAIWDVTLQQVGKDWRVSSVSKVQ